MLMRKPGWETGASDTSLRFHNDSIFKKPYPRQQSSLFERAASILPVDTKGVITRARIDKWSTNKTAVENNSVKQLEKLYYFTVQRTAR